MSNIKTYTNFITEQVRRENTVGIRSKPISEAVDHYDFPKGQKPHPEVVKRTSEDASHGIFYVHGKDGHSVQADSYDENTVYHHIDDKGKHGGEYHHNHSDPIPSVKTIKKELPHAPDHVHKAIQRDLKDNLGDDY